MRGTTLLPHPLVVLWAFRNNNTPQKQPQRVLPPLFLQKAAAKGFWSAFNLRTALQKKLAKAGIVPWPKLWHALRASAETDLARQFSLASVTAWLGNSPKVAATNYLMVTDADFDRAASESALQSALQSGPELQRNEQRQAPGNEKTPGKPGVLSKSVAGAGFDTPANSPRNTRFEARDDAHSDARPVETGANSAESCPLLSRLISVWPGLADGDRAEVIELAERLAGALDAAGGPVSHSSGRVNGSS